jgi:hypothetical protein
MRYTRSGGQTAAGPASQFTGTVQVDAVRNPDEQTAIGCAHVRFAPGARTAWHHHPKGQTLYVTDGMGSSPPAPAAPRRSAPATSSTSSRARSTGTAPPRPGSWPTSRCRKPTRTARSSPGSTTSPTRSTASEPGRPGLVDLPEQRAEGAANVPMLEPHSSAISAGTQEIAGDRGRVLHLRHAAHIGRRLSRASPLAGDRPAFRRGNRQPSIAVTACAGVEARGMGLRRGRRL